jgi:hypothetical protein
VADFSNVQSDSLAGALVAEARIYYEAPRVVVDTAKGLDWMQIGW